MTTTTTRPVDTMSKGVREAIVDQLRACQTTDEILKFEGWFNKEANSGPLYAVICELLLTRSISRGVAVKWLKTLMNDRETRLNK